MNRDGEKWRYLADIVRSDAAHPAIHRRARALMVAAGGDRQKLHERIRRHSQAAAASVKHEGRPNDLMARLADDEAFSNVDLDAALETSQFIGRAPQQVDQFITEVAQPIRQKRRGAPPDAQVSV